MSDDALRDALAAGLATLTRVVAVPIAPFYYGREIRCLSDVDASLTETDPTSPTAIAEAVFRRWDCPRGALPPDGKDAKEYGIDLRGALNRGTTEADLNALASSMRTEATKDDRVSAVPTIRFTPSANRETIEVAATITPADPSLNNFDLVFAVTSADIVPISIAGAT